jgi:broad specificity phosphatase PhoE
MKNPLILVKHSLPDIVENIPAREWRLSEEGKLLAERLAYRLSFFKPDVLVSSPEPKAGETAEIMGRELGLEVRTIENLHEHDRSNSAYLSRQEFQNTLREFFLRPDQLVFGNETANQAQNRFSKAIQTILESNKNKTIAIVAHGTVISLFVSRLTGVSDFLLWKELGLPSFVVLDMKANVILAKENIL